MTTFDQYRGMLRTNKHRLDDELEIHAEMLEQISSETARCNTRALEKKDNLARVEARLSEDFRAGSEKMTVDAIKAAVVRHSDRTRAWEQYQAARELHEQWDGLLDAWKEKGNGIRNLGMLYGSQYFALTSLQREDRVRRGVTSSEPDHEARERVQRATRGEEPAQAGRRRL